MSESVANTPISFAEWVKTYGGSKLAREIGVTSSAVTRWKTGENIPLPAHIERIIAISGNTLTADSFVKIKE